MVNLSCSCIGCTSSDDKEISDEVVRREIESLISKAKQSIQEKSVGLALHYLNQVIEREPTHAQAYLERGRIYRNQGNHQLARADYNTALNLGLVDNPYIYILRGITFEDEGQLDMAISDFTSAILLRPDDRAGYLHRGRSFFLSRKYQEAIGDYNRLLLLNSKDSVAFRNRGLTHRHQGNLDSALNDLNKSIELEPLNPMAYLNRSVILFMKGRSRELSSLFATEAAYADFNKALQLDPQVCTKALQTTSKLIKLYPSDFFHYLMRGILHHLNSNHLLAKEDHLRALDLNPQLTTTHTKLQCCVNKNPTMTATDDYSMMTNNDDESCSSIMDDFWFYESSSFIAKSPLGMVTCESDGKIMQMKQQQLRGEEKRRKSRFSIPSLYTSID